MKSLRKNVKEEKVGINNQVPPSVIGVAVWFLSIRFFRRSNKLDWGIAAQSPK